MIAAITGNLWRTIALALAGVAIALLIQIHGLPVFGGGLIAQLDRMTTLRSVEAESHRQTKANFRDAMADAHRREVFRLARVKAEQERINNDRKASANARFAALRAQRDELLSQARARAASAAVGQPVPGLPIPTFGIDAAASEDGLSLAERYECSINAVQLDELISWVERQAAIDPNEEIAR